MPSAFSAIPDTRIDSIPMNRFVNSADNGIGSSWTFSSNSAAHLGSTLSITATTNVIVTSALSVILEGMAY